MVYEHHDQAHAIVKTLGKIIGVDALNDKVRDPRFCINLMVREGSVTNISLRSEEGILPPQTFVIDYYHLPLRCRACYSCAHKVEDCKEPHKINDYIYIIYTYTYTYMHTYTSKATRMRLLLQPISLGIPPSMHQGTSNGSKPNDGVSGALDNEASHLATPFATT